MTRYFIALLTISLLFVCAKVFAFDDLEFLTLTPVTGGGSRSEMNVILPSTGGIPIYQYTQRNGPTVVLPPNRPPTFIYPGTHGGPTVMIAPSGNIYYSYPQRTR